MINVDYKTPYGYYTLTQKTSEGKKKYKVHICKANCLWAEVYFYTNNQGEDMVQLMGFFSDLKHLANCLKNNVEDGNNNYIFNSKEIGENKDIWGAIRLLTENGKKVTINYKF